MYFLSPLVSVHCKDTRIAVQVRTNKPFNGRIYALGRSETCNIDVINSDSFRLDLTMAGQDCNTQSVVSFPILKAFPKAFSYNFLYGVLVDRCLFQYCCFTTSQRCHDQGR